MAIEKGEIAFRSRRSVYIDGFAHKNPVPVACRIGNIVYSGGIHGLDPETGRTADGLDRQCELMFGHVRDIVEAAGATTADIIKMTLWMRDRGDRHVVNRHWEAMFPEPGNRPARHALHSELGSGMLIQCDFVAVVDANA
ncbi:RidA family protein [Martelella soudanensis]|uniref:RidA family protein n=1 Tax=unclassified Martelella TaxID=2629616 RepID=UPI0015DFED04|nr:MULTISPECIES: RidA family protein [unclassified Martelella]